MKNQKILTILLIVLIVVLIFQIRNMDENFSYRINDLNNRIGELESTVRSISYNLEDDSILMNKNVVYGDIEDAIQNVKVEVNLKEFTEATEVYFTTESEELKMEKESLGKYTLEYKYPIYKSVDFNFIIANGEEKFQENGGEISNKYFYNFLENPMMDMTYSDYKIEIKNLEFYFYDLEEVDQKVKSFEIYVESGDKKIPLYKGDKKILDEMNDENTVSAFIQEIKEKFEEKLENPSYLIIKFVDSFGLRYEKRYKLYPGEETIPEPHPENRVYDKDGNLVFQM